MTARCIDVPTDEVDAFISEKMTDYAGDYVDIQRLFEICDNKPMIERERRAYRNTIDSLRDSLMIEQHYLEGALGATIKNALINDDGSFSMKSLANGKFVSANPDQGGILIAQGSQVDAWERFDIRDVPGKPGVFRIWSCVMQKYVSVDETAGNILIANRDNADTWEEFRFFNETAS